MHWNESVYFIFDTYKVETALMITRSYTSFLKAVDYFKDICVAQKVTVNAFFEDNLKS